VASITQPQTARASRPRRRIYRWLAAIVIVVLLYWSPDAWRWIQDLRRAAPPALARSFDGPSLQLAQTQIVPTLDTPLEKGKNVIWCASFQLAWKRLQSDVAREPIRLTSGAAATTRLNEAADPSPDLPPDTYYAAAGPVQSGVIQRIQAEMKSRFPAAAMPSFPGAAPDGHVAYAFLQTQSRFSIPYFENRQPLQFSDSGGKRTPVRSFGIRSEDEYAYKKLRQQVKILYCARDERFQVTGCAIDLCRDSQPDQIVVARVPQGSSLAETLATVETCIAQPKSEPHEDELGVNDTLLVPDMFWRIAHRFGELEGERFLNSAMEGQLLQQALQDIEFRLDRNGAELRTEAKAVCLPIPTHFELDGPFLLYMRKRGAAQPFLVVWVDNAELLQPWRAGS